MIEFEDASVAGLWDALEQKNVTAAIIRNHIKQYPASMISQDLFGVNIDTNLADFVFIFYESGALDKARPYVDGKRFKDCGRYNYVTQDNYRRILGSAKPMTANDIFAKYGNEFMARRWIDWVDVYPDLNLFTELPEGISDNQWNYEIVAQTDLYKSFIVRQINIGFWTDCFAGGFLGDYPDDDNLEKLLRICSET